MKKMKTKWMAVLVLSAIVAGSVLPSLARAESVNPQVTDSVTSTAPADDLQKLVDALKEIMSRISKGDKVSDAMLERLKELTKQIADLSKDIDRDKGGHDKIDIDPSKDHLLQSDVPENMLSAVRAQLEAIHQEMMTSSNPGHTQDLLKASGLEQTAEEIEAELN